MADSCTGQFYLSPLIRFVTLIVNIRSLHTARYCLHFVIFRVFYLSQRLCWDMFTVLQGRDRMTVLQGRDRVTVLQGRDRITVLQGRDRITVLQGRDRRSV